MFEYGDYLANDVFAAAFQQLRHFSNSLPLFVFVDSSPSKIGSCKTKFFENEKQKQFGAARFNVPLFLLLWIFFFSLLLNINNNIIKWIYSFRYERTSCPPYRVFVGKNQKAAHRLALSFLCLVFHLPSSLSLSFFWQQHVLRKCILMSSPGRVDQQQLSLAANTRWTV